MTEKDIVSHLIEYWDNYFDKKEMFINDKKFSFNRTEYIATPDWRCDMLCYIQQSTYRQPIYTEVKFQDNKRDLIYELTKGLDYIKTRSTEKYPRYLCLISDQITDSAIYKFIESNPIIFYEYTIDNGNQFSIIRKQ